MRLGPRNRRRLAIGAGIVGVAVAIVVAVLLTRSTTHSGTGLRSQCVRHPDGTCTIDFLRGVVFGMTSDQVQHLLGKPTSKQGRCWLYPQSVAKYLATQGVVKSVQDVCFTAGRLSDTKEQDYVRSHGKLVLWHPPPPALP